MAQSFLNQITDPEVAIGIEQILIAPFPTIWTPTKIADPVDDPPVGFRNLGAVVEDSVTLTVSREKFQLSTGIPRNLQYEAVMGITGTLEATLIARRGTLAFYGLGGADPQHNCGNSPALITTVTNKNEFGVNSTVATQAWTIGYLIAMAPTTLGVRTSREDAYINSISTAGASVFVVTSPSFAATPSTSDFVDAVLNFTRNAFGTSLVTKFHLLGTTDFIDGVQIVHQFPEVTVSGDWVEEYRPDQEGRIPMAFSAQGFTAATYDNSTSHLLIGERYWFNKV